MLIILVIIVIMFVRKMVSGSAWRSSLIAAHRISAALFIFSVQALRACTEKIEKRD